VVEVVPLERIVLETDCPYLAPEPNRGRRNNSAYLKYVAEAIAGIKGITPEETEAVTWENACRMYGLPAEVDQV
jgi:TatD DNase family protein